MHCVAASGSPWQQHSLVERRAPKNWEFKACEFKPLEGMPFRLKNVGAALFRLGYVSAGLPDLTGIIIRSGHGASVNG